MTRHAPACAACSIELGGRACMKEKGSAPKGCPTLTRKEILKEANAAYTDQTLAFARTASVQEAACYANRDVTPYIMQPVKTRIEETCEFAGRMGYRSIGLAFCIGLSKEAAVVSDILAAWGFEVVSACCKAGKTSKEFLGLTDADKIYRGTDESMCNPIFQARLLNHEKTDFNVLLGLCVGHDTLFLQHAKAPVTVLAVKDRVTAHNPLAPVYNADSYFKKLRFPDTDQS